MGDVEAGYNAIKDCDIVICVARTKGVGSQFLAEKQCPQVWIEKGRRCNCNSAISQTEEMELYQEMAQQTADCIYQALQMLS